MYYGGYYASMIVLIPAMIFTLIVQARINSAYSTYSRIENSRRISGAQAARMLLDANGLNNVPVNVIRGNALTNYFDPKNNTINLSEQVFRTDSIASICIACHEVGHAVQYATGYAPIRFRNTIVPLVTLTSNLAWPIIIIGLVLSGRSPYGSLLFDIGVICFLLVIVFHLVTLPVEFNASNRALSQMQESGIVNSADLAGSRKVLRAAGMTYVAALATAVASLLRILLLRGNRR
ncbi:MAG: zinc metallopeptidase [Mogibacterium sp.]|nr:zinc metallopeptidase [Mogibacterium sp.]